MYSCTHNSNAQTQTHTLANKLLFNVNFSKMIYCHTKDGVIIHK